MSTKLSGKVFCLVTGSSSGLGQTIAQLLVKKDGILQHAATGSKIMLMSRDDAKIEGTKSLMLQNGSDMHRFDIEKLSCDLSNVKETENAVSETLANLRNDFFCSFKHVFIFTIAGSVGDVSKTRLEYDWNASNYQEYFNLNVVSPIFIITKFCQHFVTAKKCVVVHMSSLAAVQPLPYLDLYCSTKTSMDMFLKCLTLDDPKIETLSYAPGHVDTEMAKDMRTKYGSESSRKMYQEMFDNGTIVQPIDTINKMLTILQENTFNSGDHLDYYDLK